MIGFQQEARLVVGWNRPPRRLEGTVERSMKAAVHREYGPPDVVQIEDVEKLVPNDNEVLIEVRAASVNPLDWHHERQAVHRSRVHRIAQAKEPTYGR
jgi:hypothetical protein